MDRKSPLNLFILAAAMFIVFHAYNLFFASEVGRSFDREADLLQFQNETGFVFLGKFGVKFPATVSSVQRSNHSIEFHLQDGTKHSYNGYEGYGLKVVKLKCVSGGESVFVFRTAEKL